MLFVLWESVGVFHNNFIYIYIQIYRNVISNIVENALDNILQGISPTTMRQAVKLEANIKHINKQEKNQ